MYICICMCVYIYVLFCLTVAVLVNHPSAARSRNRGGKPSGGPTVAPRSAQYSHSATAGYTAPASRSSYQSTCGSASAAPALSLAARQCATFPARPHGQHWELAPSAHASWAPSGWECLDHRTMTSHPTQRCSREHSNRWAPSLPDPHHLPDHPT